MKSIFSITRVAELAKSSVEWLQKNNITPPTVNSISVSNSGDVFEMELLGSVGKDWDGNGITEKDVRDAFKTIPKGSEIKLFVNSTGGFVGEGLGIYNAIKERSSEVAVKITGYALSAASFFPLAASKVISPKSSAWMIHPAQWMAIGSGDEMRKTAEVMDTLDAAIISIYKDKTGKSEAEIKAAMKKETWFTGEQAVAWGLADSSDDSDQSKNLATDNGATNNQPAPASPGDNSAVQAAVSNQQPVTSAPTLSPAQPTPPVNAVNNQQPKPMPEPTQPAAATPAAQPVTDFTPVINAINALGEKLNAAPPGAAPLSAHVVQNLGNPLVEKYNGLIGDLPARASLAKATYNDLRKQLMIANGCNPNLLTAENRFDFNNADIRNANTVDAALANTILANDFVTTMRTYCAPWTAFTRRVEMSPVSKRQTLEVSLISSAGSMQKNATNYETGDTTHAPIPVVTDEYSKSFHITRPQSNLGLQLAAEAPTHAKILGEGLSALFTALMTNANFGADVVIGAAANFDSADLPAVLALGKNFTRTTLVLDGGHLAYLLPTTRESFAFGEPGAYGFDGGIYKNNLWTSGAADICGLVCGADAIVSAWGQADGLPAGEAISQSNVDVMGFPFSVTVWFSRATREVWSSFQIVGGVSAGDKTQANVLTTQ